ncbi:helix-turn-helix domain-containing protein [Paraburkholderia sp. C35]|uniref:helix-turn-helix domain-containing protein n=1 Tax=Paraburkholderia sp. C35 TaxID=2126993 RepID=UPI000D689214|nr:helix-turn-helix domain-containing protein [Paraburkholderia sp. C35]
MEQTTTNTAIIQTSSEVSATHPRDQRAKLKARTDARAALKVLGWLTTQQVVERLGVTSSRVTQLCAKGQIPGAVRVGERWLFPADCIETYLKARVLRAEQRQALKDQHRLKREAKAAEVKARGWLSTDDVLKMMGVSRVTLARNCKQLQGMQVGRRLYFDPAVVAAFQANREATRREKILKRKARKAEREARQTVTQQNAQKKEELRALGWLTKQEIEARVGQKMYYIANGKRVGRIVLYPPDSVEAMRFALKRHTDAPLERRRWYYPDEVRTMLEKGWLTATDVRRELSITPELLNALRTAADATGAEGVQRVDGRWLFDPKVVEEWRRTLKTSKPERQMGH